jgi:hypothetical protein
MAAQRKNHANRVLIVVAAGKADYVDAVFVATYGMRDKAGALNRVDDEDDIANSFSAVTAKITLPRSFTHN